MVAINLLAAILFAAAAAAGVASVIRRARRLNRAWRDAEPDIVARIETAVGQRVAGKVLLNANDSADFSHGRGFFLWLAFTADFVAFADRNALADQREGAVYLSHRKDAALTRLPGRFAELRFRDRNAAEPVRFVVLCRSRDFELLGRYLRPAQTDD